MILSQPTSLTGPTRNAERPRRRPPNLLYKYGGDYYGASLDGDFQTWVYNKSYFEDSAHAKPFEDAIWSSARPAKHLGRKRSDQCRVLHGPHRPWRQQDLRQRQRHGAVLGFATFLRTDLPPRRCRTCIGSTKTGNPNLDTDQAIKAASEYVKSREWAHPDALSWTLCRGLCRDRKRTNAASDDLYERHQICGPDEGRWQPGKCRRQAS